MGCQGSPEKFWHRLGRIRGPVLAVRSQAIRMCFLVRSRADRNCLTSPLHHTACIQQSLKACLILPSANMVKDMPWVGKLSQPKVYGQIGLWHRACPSKPVSCKTRQRKQCLRHTETSGDEAPERTKLEGKLTAGRDTEETGLRRDSAFLPHSWWIPVLQVWKETTHQTYRGRLCPRYKCSHCSQGQAAHRATANSLPVP